MSHRRQRDGDSLSRVRVGNRNLAMHSELVEMTDSTPLFAARDFPALRGRLEEQGFLFVRGVIPPAVVAAARRKMLLHLRDKGAMRDGTHWEDAFVEYQKAWDAKQKHLGSTSTSKKQKLPPFTAHAAPSIMEGMMQCTLSSSSSGAGEAGGKMIPGWTVDAESGGLVGGREADDSVAGWREVGTSRELTDVYNGAALHSFYQQLFEQDRSYSSRAHLKAAGVPSFTTLPSCTWLRAKGAGEVTAEHADYYYFRKNTDIFSRYYTPAQHCTLQQEEAKRARDAALAQQSKEQRQTCQVCHDPRDAASTLLCDLCDCGYHMACLTPALTTMLPEEEEFHCPSCCNNPLDYWTCWVALGDIRGRDGRLALVAGSHRLGGYESSARAELLPAEYTSAFEAASVWQTPADIRMGDIILFNVKTVHAATRNGGDRFRLSLDTRVTACKGPAFLVRHGLGSLDQLIEPKQNHTRTSQRPAAAVASEAILLMSLAAAPTPDISFPLHNYPPWASIDASRAAAAARHPSALPQALRPVAEALRGLQENSDALGVQVGEAVAAGPGAGVSLHATRSFAAGATLGYWWGVVLQSEEQWIFIRDASAATTAAQAALARAAATEDYWSPAHHGVYRCLEVPAQRASGGDHLLASEQCPMAYLNQAATAAQANVRIDFPAHAFEPGAATAYAYISCTASRPIAAGEELLTQYSWLGGDRSFKEAALRYSKYHASLMQRSFAELAPFERMRAHHGRFARMAATASTHFKRADAAGVGDAITAFSSQLPLNATLDVDGRMQTFHSDRFMLWVPPALDGVLTLCEQWVHVADSDSRVDRTDIGAQSTIRNGGQQLHLRAGHPLFARTTAVMRLVVERFLGLQRAQRLHCVGLLLLTMRPGDGPMPFHSDQVTNTKKNRAHARECWSALLYTSDCQATALPLLSEDQMDQAVHPDTAPAITAELLTPAAFFAGRVSRGSILVMRGDVPHCSPQHRGEANRITLYALFSPTADEEQIVHSQFPLGIDH